MTAKFQGCHFLGGPLDGEWWPPTSGDWSANCKFIPQICGDGFHLYQRLMGDDWRYKGVILDYGVEKIRIAE